MKLPQHNSGLNSRYILISFIAVLLSYVLHELAHWTIGEALGYEMGMTLNTAFPINGSMDSEFDVQMLNAAGPVFTIFQAFIFYVLLRKGSSNILYPFLFVPLYMRVLAGVMNFINLNDEGRISVYLGIGTFTVSIFVCLLIGFMFYDISRRRKFTTKFQLVNFFITMVFSSILILANQFLTIKLIS